MASDRYANADNDRTPSGISWRVGSQGEALMVYVGGTLVSLEGEQRDRFAEAVARAVTPGQVPAAPKVYYACCIHCEHDGESDPDLDDERHPNPCREGCRAVTVGQRVKHGPGCQCTPCKAEPSYQAAQAAGTGD
jgi:hypothetical protein